MKKFSLAIDAMGGDVGPRLCVPATLKFLAHHPEMYAILVGDQHALEAALHPGSVRQRITIVHAEQTVTMADAPAMALRHKRCSSMWRALEALADGRAHACISAGNTGALMAMSRHLLGTFGDMARPAICKPIPTARGDSFLLDVGANLNCSVQQLLQFALMGSALAKIHGRHTPSVALLNVGAEASKGLADIRQAYALMRAHPALSFKGFVEGHQLYRGEIDVVVCDGFVGNVALKVSEGAASFVLDSLKREFSSSFWRRCLGMLNHAALDNWRRRFDPSRYNGAAFLGLQKIVIKSHGGASERGFFQALATARQQVYADIPGKLSGCC